MSKIRRKRKSNLDLANVPLDAVLNHFKGGKRRKRRKRQIGGGIPWVVNFKKGGEIVSDLVSISQRRF